MEQWFGFYWIDDEDEDTPFSTAKAAKRPLNWVFNSSVHLNGF
jgi:hypothetical protein